MQSVSFETVFNALLPALVPTVKLSKGKRGQTAWYPYAGMKSEDDDDDDDDKNDNHDDHVGDDDDNNDNIFECEDDYHTGCQNISQCQQ